MIYWQRDVLSSGMFRRRIPFGQPVKALAAIMTHDLPTLTGIWTGVDPDTQRQMGLQADTAANEKFREKLIKTSSLSADAFAWGAIRKTFEQLGSVPPAIVIATKEAACVTTPPRVTSVLTGLWRYLSLWSNWKPHSQALAQILSRMNSPE